MSFRGRAPWISRSWDHRETVALGHLCWIIWYNHTVLLFNSTFQEIICFRGKNYFSYLVLFFFSFLWEAIEPGSHPMMTEEGFSMPRTVWSRGHLCCGSKTTSIQLETVWGHSQIPGLTRPKLVPLLPPTPLALAYNLSPSSESDERDNLPGCPHGFEEKPLHVVSSWPVVWPWDG